MAEDVIAGAMLEIGIEATGFKAQMSEISRRMALAKSEFLAAGGSIKGFQDTTEGTAAKAAMLSEQIQLQKARVQALESEYNQAANGLGENSKQAQDLQIKLNNARGEMVRMENDLAGATSGLNSMGNEMQQEETKADHLHSSMGKLGSVMSNIGGALGRAAVTGLAAVGAAATAAFAVFSEYANGAMDSADETQRLADVTGYTAEQIQVMSYQGKALGVDIETMTGAQAKLTKAMAGAKGHNDQAKAFKALGIAVRDSTGHLRDSKDVMAEAIDKLGGVSNETERDALAMKLFGKSAMEMNPLIKAGSAGLAELEDAARKSGAVMSNDTVASLDNLGDNMDALKTSMTGIAGTALSAAMPALNGIMGSVQGLASSAAEAMSTGNWGGFASQLSSVLQQAAQQITSMLPTFIKVGTTILTTLVGAIASAVPVILPQLVEGVLALLDALTGIIVEQGPLLITTAIDAVGVLIQGLIQALPQLVEAAIQMVLALVNGISKQLPTLIPAAVGAVLTVVETLANNLPMLIDAAIGLILALVDGLISALPNIVESAPRIITSLVNGIVGALPKLLDAALQIILALVNAFPDYFPKLITATADILGSIVGGLISAVGKVWDFIPKFWDEIKNAFASKDWGQMGKDIIAGLIDGLKSVGGKVWEALKGIVTSSIDSFKNFFGIHSPSTYMRDQLGIHLGGGIAEGIQGSAGTVGNAMLGLRSMLDAGAISMKFTQAFSSAGIQGSSTVTNNTKAPVININGPVTLADKGSRDATLQQLQFLAAT